MCVSVCEYLVIWCDKTTVHEIIDCSSKTMLTLTFSYIKECNGEMKSCNFMLP
jgi:hypothetical protein